MSKATLDRFLSWAGTAALGLLVSLSACGNGNGGGAADANPFDTISSAPCETEDPSVSIANNNPHAAHDLEISKDDVAAADEMTYDIQGDAQHTHEVTITGADFMSLQNGGSVTVESTEASAGPIHTHDVTISCN